MSLAIIPNDLIQALCWTLLHSLWQGLLLAIITGAILLATKKSGAAIRYKLLTGLFFLFVVTAIVTFIKTYMATVPLQQAIADQASVIVDPNFTITTTQTVELSLYTKFAAYFNQHASLIVTIWFIIFLARFIKLSANLLYIQRIRHYKTSTPSLTWRNKLETLATKMGLRKTVALLESGIVKVPAVIGMMKPVILVPIGMLAKLPVEEIEAILLHELAHIQRRDYLVNLLQSMMETIFFFNPAVLWLSSMIREERENCCDDMAIAITNNKTKFINALISFQEYNLASPAQSMAFPGKKNHLLNRVKRIVHERNKTLNSIEKSILTCSIALLIFFSFVAAKKDTPPKEKKQAAPEVIADTMQYAVQQPEEHLYTATAQAVTKTEDETEKSDSVFTAVADEEPVTTLTLNAAPVQDTTTKIKFTSMSTSEVKNDSTSTLYVVAVTKDGTTYKLSKKDGNITSFSVNGTEIDKAQLSEHQGEINAIEQAISHSRKKQPIKLRSDVNLQHSQQLEKNDGQKNKALFLARTKQKDTEQQVIEKRRNDSLHARKTLVLNNHFRADSARTQNKKFRMIESQELRMKRDSLYIERKPKTLEPSKPLQTDKKWVMTGDIKLEKVSNLQ